MRIAVAHTLTIDFEAWPQIALLKATGQVATAGGDALTRQTDRILDLLARHGVHATFFTLGITAERWPHLVQRIAAEGHEVACHGYNHLRVYSTDRAAFAADLARAASLLTDITGRRPRGFRAPEFSITDRSLWALDVLAEQGFGYDSSIFPVHNRRYGIPSWPRLPRRVADGRLVELPPATLDLGVLNMPVAGGGYWRALPDRTVLQALDGLTSRGESAIVYLHPYEFDDRDPGPVGHGLTWRQRLIAGSFRLAQSTRRSSVLAKLNAALPRYQWMTAAALAETVQ